MDRMTKVSPDGKNVIVLDEEAGKWTISQSGDRTYKIFGNVADRLAAYEDTGLTPKEIAAMKSECSDTFQAHLQQLCDIKDKQIAVLQSLCEEMENTAKEYRAFKEYFDALYGRNLTVGNWHLNGALEPFDNFYDKAVNEMKKECGKMNDSRGFWRGKRLDNGKWVEGYYIHLSDNDLHIIVSLDGQYNRSDPSTLGECTGFYDKNGKLIFEGDICTATNNFVDGEYGVVKYCEQEAMFIVDFKSERLDFSRQLCAAEVEVIGNIHDNPELLNATGKDI